MTLFSDSLTTFHDDVEPVHVGESREDEVNEEVLRRLPGQETIFSSIDSTEDGSPEFAPEFLNTLSTSGMPPHLLKLKVGALVILMSSSLRRL